MDTNQLLQVMATGLLLIGILSVAASRVATPAFLLAGETAFWTGVVAVSVGFVTLADLRHRSHEGQHGS
jgi:hypothetical protein